MNYPKTRTNNHGSVTIFDFKYTLWDNIACYWVHASGSPEAYFGEDMEIFQMEEHDDGMWIAWYYSTDPDLIASRDELVRLGGWERAVDVQGERQG